MASDNMFSDLNKMIDQLGKDKGIDKQVIVEAVTQGMLVAARKVYGTYKDIEASYNDETGEVELFQFNEVVTDEAFEDEQIEIILDDARKLDPEAQLNDSIGIKLDTSELGRIAAQTAKQIILQQVRDAEREIIFNEFEQRKGEITSGIVRRVERNHVVVDMGRTEAVMPPREQIPGENFKQGDRVQGHLLDVRQTTRGPQIIMSRACSDYLVKLFEAEVPEVYDGVVQIMAAAREPGQRAKIAVFSKDNSVDPVGACVGMKGSRVQNIVQELQGEKIDIVQWNEDITRFACNALAPAEISRVFLDETNHEMEIVVPDNQLSLAIGKRGQNVRLASKLSGWKIDIMSESNASARTAESIFNLMLMPDMSETMAQNIFQSGFGSFQSLADASAAEVMAIPGFDQEAKAQELVDQAAALLKKYEDEGLEIPQAPVVEVQQEVKGGAKAQAEQQLREQLAELDNDNEEEVAGDAEEPAVEAAAETEPAADAAEVPAEQDEAVETEAPAEPQ